MPPVRDPLVAALKTYRKPERQGFEDAWVGLEPTFQTRRSVELFAKWADDEDRYFEHPYMISKVRAVARRIERRVDKHARGKKRPEWCLFDRAKRHATKDKWKNFREQVDLHWKDRGLEALEVKFGIDPSTFEFGIKPVPLRWFYDERFIAFLEETVWHAPRKEGMSVSMANGGGQFHLSAKTFLTGSLLADVIATKLNHPELSTWIMDWANRDDRAFRATSARCAAFVHVLDRYWAGAFHPRAAGVLTAEHALFDRSFGPSDRALRTSMNPRRGPTGDDREVFQTNFAFGRAIKQIAQSVHPGYWQDADPEEDGYRPEQVARYSEANLARLQIAGELHVKDHSVLDAERVPDSHAPLELSMLAGEASLELRGHMSHVSARDCTEAVLLEVHHAMYLARHPHVAVTSSLLQDRLLGEAENTIRKHASARTLSRLHERARVENLAASRGRLKSDFVEPEALFYAAWKALPAKEQGAIAREAVSGFVELVEQADAMDPRKRTGDPMEAHRHRVHPLLWGALEKVRLPARDVARRELERWKLKRATYLARRPTFSQTDESPPWIGRGS